MDETAVIEKPALKSTRKHFPNYRIDIADIIHYADQGLGPTEIGKLLGCHKSNITKRLQDYGYCPVTMQNYRKSKDKVFEYMQHELSRNFNESDIKKMSGRDKIISMGILEDKIRDIRGQSASSYPTNITLNVVVNSGDSVPVTVHPTIDITPVQCNDNNNLDE